MKKLPARLIAIVGVAQVFVCLVDPIEYFYEEERGGYISE